MSKQPNILFIQADQLTAFALSAYGNKACVTPTLDSLAGEGVVFENAYCNSPLCAPSRGSMMTGQLVSNAGVFDNGAELPASIPTMAHFLREMGYRTCLSGKMHFCGPDQLHGYEERLTSDIYPADFSWTANWQKDVHGDLTDSRMITKAGLCTDSVQIRYDTQVTTKSIEYILRHADSEKQRPMFLTVSYTHPHDPFVCTRQFWDLYEDVNIPLPLTGVIPDEERDAHSRNLLRQMGMVGKTVSEDQLRRVRRAYFGAISFIDEQIAKLRSALEMAGIADNTIIVFTSDHGEMLGERGMWLKKNFFEPAMRVPLIVHFPSWFEARRIDELVSLVDLLPTFSAFGNEGESHKDFQYLDGRNLFSLMTGAERGGDSAVYAEILSEGVQAPAFMIRRGEYKYMHFAEYEPMMFNLKDDPQELTNLIGNPDHEVMEQTLRAELAAKWDQEGIREAVLRSQQQRLLVHRSSALGTRMVWDFDAGEEGKGDWFRGQSNYNDWAFDYTS